MPVLVRVTDAAAFYVPLMGTNQTHHIVWTGVFNDRAAIMDAATI